MSVTTPGRILIVNGTSGAGKSTACELFAKRSSDFWLLYGIDHFMAGTFPAAFGHHGPHAAQGIEAVPVDPAKPDGPLKWVFGPKGWAAFEALHQWIADAARAGCNIVFDHLAMVDPPLLQDLAWRTEGLDVTFVTLKPPFEVLEARVAERRMDKKLPDFMGEDVKARIVDRLARLRPWFTEAVYTNDICDLEIDSAALGPEAVCEAIEARMAAGPGAAFERLREKYPR